MIRTIVLTLVFFFQEPPPPPVHMPTSAAIDLARKVARDLGYPIDKYPRLYFFDVLMNQGGKPWLAGYISVGFYGNGHPINHFEINEATGQVIDSSTCELFDFADLRDFQKAQQKVSGSSPKSIEDLKNEIGCDRLTTVRKPVLPKTRLSPRR